MSAGARTGAAAAGASAAYEWAQRAWWSPTGRGVMVTFSVVTVAAGVVAGAWRVSG